LTSTPDRSRRIAPNDALHDAAEDLPLGRLLHHYKFTRGGKVIAEVSKRWFPVKGTYGAAIAEGEEPVLILATAVVIDMFALITG
jgi:uncharacterized protein YxjI